MSTRRVNAVVGSRSLFGLFALVLLLVPQAAFAQASLSVEPITWNVIGLDSNDVNVGPNRFPVGARVCNTGSVPLTDVQATFTWTTANAFIDLRAGSLNPITNSSIAVGECADFYFEVEITRNVAAFDTTRGFQISVGSAEGASGGTPTPREIYVEHLISQSRNAILDIQYGTDTASLTSVPSGGSMPLEVGKTYFIRLVASTATQGYEQLESFVNFPNTVFQILGVETTYSADTSPNVSSPDDKLYADGCTWESDLNSPNYRTCLGDGKAGGNIEVTYEVRILSLPSTNPEPLSSLVHDFSGSSFHYNADYDTSVRFAEIISPLGLGFSKSFDPSPTSTNGISNLTFTISNPFSLPFSNISFSDNFPANLVVATPASFSTIGCGTPTFAPTAGGSSISFSGGSVAAFGTCIVGVQVTPTVSGDKINTSGSLVVDGTDTALTATDTLQVIDGPVPPPTCTYTVATFNMTSGVAFENTNPPGYTTKSGFAATATAAYSGTGTASISTTIGNPVNSWGATGGWASNNTGFPNSNAPYL